MTGDARRAWPGHFAATGVTESLLSTSAEAAPGRDRLLLGSLLPMAAVPASGQRRGIDQAQLHARGQAGGGLPNARRGRARRACAQHARIYGVPARIERWQRDHANFRFVPVRSEAGDDPSWTGRRGLVHEALLADHPDLRGHEVYSCGSVRMVEAAAPDFIAHGLAEQFCFSDAFTPTRSPSPAPTTA